MGRLSLFLTLLIWIALLTAELTFFNTAKIAKIQCNFNPNWVTNGSCKIKAINRNRHELTIKGFVTKPMNNFWIDLKTYKFYSVYRPFIVAFSTNICNLYNDKAYKDLKQFGSYVAVTTFTNLNHSCPYVGWMFLEKAVFLRNFLQIVIPPGRYRADLNVSDGIDKNPALQAKIYVDVLEHANP